MLPFNGWKPLIIELTLWIFAVQCKDPLTGLEADSWGHDFIFMMPLRNNKMEQAVCNIFAMIIEKNITVNVEYNILSNGNSEKKKDQLIFRNSYEYFFENLRTYDMSEGMHMLADDRIHITSTDKISLIAYLTGPASIDYFLVHPVGMGSNYYGFSLPGSSIVSLYFLPLGKTNETILQSTGIHNVSLTTEQDNSIKTIEQSMEQYTIPVENTISIWIHDQLHLSNIDVKKRTRHKSRKKLSFEIARLLVIVTVRSTTIEDFGCFMPTPMIVDRCGELTTWAYYPAGAEFVNNVLMTAPSYRCPWETVDIFTSVKHSEPLSVKWNETGQKINLRQIASTKTFAVTSKTTIMNIIHYGSNEKIFIHEIPAYSQWVNGDSAVIIPKDSDATLYVFADDYGREATMEGFEYPSFEPVEDVSSDFSLYLYTRKLSSGVYRVGIDQELGGRYIAIVIAEFHTCSIGYVAAINLHKIPPPIFITHSTTAVSTTTKLATTPLLLSTMTTITTTRGSSYNVLSNNLLAICVFFIIIKC